MPNQINPNQELLEILNPNTMDFESCYGLNVSNNQSFYVKSFGYEIEGGFSDYEDIEDHECNDDCNDDGCDYSHDNPRTSKYFKHDGSVETRHYTAGEIASPIFYIGLDSSIKKFRRFVKEHIPQEVNSTTGHHIHLGMNNLLAYNKIMDIDYYNQFKKEVKKFFDSCFANSADIETQAYYRLFLSRYANENHYCQDLFSPNAQASYGYAEYDGTSSGRYTMLNYCYPTHRTIECRLFPASNNPEIVCMVTEWFIKFTNTWLKKQESKSRVKKHKVESTSKTFTNKVEVILSCV